MDKKNFEKWLAYRYIKWTSLGRCPCQICKNVRQFIEDIESGVNTYATEKEMTISLIKMVFPDFRIFLETNTNDDGDKKNE